jgi:anti-anti-sigma regulatory factor/anti-sigma regulatory factor (Ser/Thr protein kinase)
MRQEATNHEAAGPSHLTWLVEHQSAAAILVLTGRLDLTTAIDARAALYKILADQPSAIVVDLAGVTLVDDVVLTLFSAFARTAAAEWPGCPLALSAPQDDLARALHRMAISRAVPVHDDRAGALAAVERVPAPRRLVRRLDHEPGAIAAARDAVRTACTAWHLPGLVADAELLVTELVSNAIRYSSGDIALRILLAEHHLHLSVRDANPEPPRLVSPDADTGEGGRGLVLIDAIATSWGMVRNRSGKTVWATLRIRC